MRHRAILLLCGWLVSVSACSTSDLEGRQTETGSWSAWTLTLEDPRSDEVLFGPCTRLLPENNLVTICEVAQFAYIQDWDVEIGGGGAVSWDPIIDVIHEGLALELSEERDSAGGRRLRIHLLATAIARPVRNFTTNLANGHDITLQLPDISHANCVLDAFVPPGAAQFEIARFEYPHRRPDGRVEMIAARLRGVSH